MGISSLGKGGWKVLKKQKTKQKTEPALLQLQFAKYVEAGIFDIFIPYSTIKCIKFR